MKHRTTVKPRKDKKIFSHTAAKTKKINVAPRLMRGGIRL